VWHNRPFEAIIQEIISDKHDLVLKMAHQHDKLEAVIFTPTDWHLLRKCPCPVWMVKDQPWPEGGKALVAVNLASEENYHNALNEKLVRETIELAEQVNHTEVHLVGAYPVTPINIAIELPDFDPSVYNDAIRGQHLLAMKALRQKFGIDESRPTLKKGYLKRSFLICQSIFRRGSLYWGRLVVPGSQPLSSAIPLNRLSITFAATCWRSNRTSTRRRLSWTTRKTISSVAFIGVNKTVSLPMRGIFCIKFKKYRVVRPASTALSVTKTLVDT
jgi:nucleotide-binding universal stress UspA family protein